MKVQDTFRPIKISKHENGGWLFEFDRYFGGWVLLKTKGKAGAKVTIHYESIAAGWTVGEKDTYILKGDSEGETYEPRFTFHPVRYVRVEGLEGKPTLDTLQGREVYTDVDMHGRFTCSNELLNQIHGNIQRSLKVALKGIIIDCVHREPIAYNEPCGIFGTLAIRKCMPDLWTRVARDIQLASSDSGDLSDMVPILPGMKRPSDVSQNASYPMLIWYLYECHGDERLLEQHYQKVKAWVDFIGRELADSTHVVKKGWLGEHMLPKSGSVPGWSFYTKETPKEFIWTCYYYQNVRVLADMSRVLGKKEQEERYAKLAQKIHAVINKTWLDPKTGHYATRSQTSEILALALDIVPQKNEQQLIENIAGTINDNGGRLRVGHVGLPGFMESLVDHGLGEVVYKAVNTTEFPGWGYMISQGATTVWEGWSLATKVEEWNNHIYHAEESMIFLTGVSRFFYDSIAGIQEPAFYGTREFEPGYGLIRIKPHVLGDLKHAEASIKTVRGIISSSWKRTKNSFVLEIEIPVNSTAKVSVPTLGLNEFAITEGGKAIWQNDSYVDGVAGVADGRRDADWVTFDVGSGSYRFELKGKLKGNEDDETHD
jgi:alpha-L-rhamnosidase